MTTLHSTTKKCINCGCMNRYQVVGSTIALDSPDLDTRPAPLQRETIEYGVERCSNCNYASSDIEEKIKFDANILKSEQYIKILKSSYPELAKSYMLASVIKDSINDYISSAMLMLNACWVLDDNKVDAKKTRIVTAKLFEKTELDETIRMIMIDLYRRAEDFSKAKELIKETYDFIEDGLHKRILMCEEKLVDNKDSSCHTCSEISDIIGEDITEEEADSLEEVKRKLFDENSNEPIRLYGMNGLVTFQQIAIIPLIKKKKQTIYAILQPEDDDIPDDEALVFEIVGGDEIEELKLVTDDDVTNKVFEEYYRLIENNNN